jgi:hypothetical protein
MQNIAYSRFLHCWSRFFILLPLLLVLMLSGCGTAVITDYDETYNFSNLKVYAWSEQEKKINQDPLVDNDLMYGRIIDAVDTELMKRGFKLAEKDESADFFVGFHVKAEEKFHVSSFDSWYAEAACWPRCYRYDHFSNHYRDDIDLWQYKQGVFMVDIIEPITDRLVWRGMVSKRLVNGAPTQRAEYINEVIESIFTQFPVTLE